jgi:hypothetical protein
MGWPPDDNATGDEGGYNQNPFAGMIGTPLQPANSFSVKYEASRIAKSGAGLLFGFTVYSSNAAAQFILLFDSNTLPADGALPLIPFPIGATQGAAFSWTPGRSFSRGIVLCNSTTANSKTIGAADTWFDVQFL